MPPGEDDLPEGFVLDEEPAPSAQAAAPELPEGFEVETETADFDRMRPTAGQGLSAVPEGMRETGSRVLVAPETEISVDPTGQRPDVVRERGEFTEFREVAPPPAPQPSGLDRLLSSFGRFASEAGQVGPGNAAIRALGRIDPAVAAESFVRAPFHGFADEILGAAGALGARAGENVARMAPDAARAFAQSDVGREVQRTARDLDRLDVLPMPQAGQTLAQSYRGTRDRLRAREAEQREQDPGSALAGDALYAAPAMAIPGAQGSALARIATMGGLGLASGATRGAGESTAEDLGGVALDAGTGAAVEGLAGAALTGGGELGGRALRRLGEWARRAAPGVQESANRARLEASGVWGRPQLARLRQQAGPQGPARLAEWLRTPRQIGDETRLRPIGEGGIAGRLLGPSSPSATADAIDIQADSGELVGSLARELGDLARDAAAEGTPATYRTITGAEVPRGHIDIRQTAQWADDIAEALERNASTEGQLRAAAAMRRQAEVLRARGERLGEVVPFDEAWRMRRAIDEEVRRWASDPTILDRSGRLQQLRRMINRQMNDAAESVGGDLAQRWVGANRDAHMSRLALELGVGEQALSQQGGVGGAAAQGQAVVEALSDPSLAALARTVAVRPTMQALRMRGAGVQARALEALAPRLRALGHGRWAATLEAAQRRGQTALAAAHYALSRRDPEYRQAVEAAQQEQEQE